VIGLM